MAITKTVTIIVDTIAELAAFVNQNVLAYCSQDGNLYFCGGGVSTNLTGGGGWNGGSPINPTLANFYFADDFLSGVVVTNYFSTWALINNATFDNKASEVNHPGIFRIKAAAGAASGLQLTLQNSGIPTIVPSTDFIFNWIFRPTTDDANTAFRLGLGNVFSANPPINGIYVEKKAADTNLFGVCRFTSAETRVDLGAVVANTWYKATVRRIDAATIGFAINDGTELTINTNVPTVNVYAGASLIAAVAEKYLDLDFFDIAFSGLVRY